VCPSTLLLSYTSPFSLRSGRLPEKFCPPPLDQRYSPSGTPCSLPQPRDMSVKRRTSSSPIPSVLKHHHPLAVALFSRLNESQPGNAFRKMGRNSSPFRVKPTFFLLCPEFLVGEAFSPQRKFFPLYFSDSISRSFFTPTRPLLGVLDGFGFFLVKGRGHHDAASPEPFSVQVPFSPGFPSSD